MEADISMWQGTGHFYFALTPSTPRLAAPASQEYDSWATLNLAANFCKLEQDRV